MAGPDELREIRGELVEQVEFLRPAQTGSTLTVEPEPPLGIQAALQSSAQILQRTAGSMESGIVPLSESRISLWEPQR